MVDKRSAGDGGENDGIEILQDPEVRAFLIGIPRIEKGGTPIPAAAPISRGRADQASDPGQEEGLSPQPEAMSALAPTGQADNARREAVQVFARTDADLREETLARPPVVSSFFSRKKNSGPRHPENVRVPGHSRKHGLPPVQVLIGWIEESSRKDVLEHARGFASDHLETLETAWIAMEGFRGGTFFEVHEGGSGRAYLPELIEELSRDPDQVLWVPSGTKLNRVVTLSIVEGRPFSMMLNEADSAKVRASGHVPVERTGRMKRLSTHGNGVLAVGASLFALSFIALLASAFLASRVGQQPIPSLPHDVSLLPHGQIITLSNALRDDRWVSRILFENGQWRAEFETFDELTLSRETEDAQREIERAIERDRILQEQWDAARSGGETP